MSEVPPGEVCTCTTSPCSRAVPKIRSSCSWQASSLARPPSRKLVFSAATPCSPASASAAVLSSASCGRGETHSPHRIRSSAAAASTTRGLKPNETDASGTP